MISLTRSLLLWTMLRVRCLRGGSRGAEAAHLIGAMVGIMVVYSFLLENFCLFKTKKHMSVSVNKEMLDIFFTRLLSLEIRLIGLSFSYETF